MKDQGPGPRTGALRRADLGRTGHNDHMNDHKRRLPPWLVGLIAAVLIFAVALILMSTMGFGDDPVLGS